VKKFIKEHFDQIGHIKYALKGLWGALWARHEKSFRLMLIGSITLFTWSTLAGAEPWELALIAAAFLVALGMELQNSSTELLGHKFEQKDVRDKNDPEFIGKALDRSSAAVALMSVAALLVWIALTFLN
jgi:diacylglycerol kinase